MSLTVVVTRDVSARYRGFLSSIMPEISPGVYVSPDISAAVRERMWAIVEDWWGEDPGTAAVLVFPDRNAVGRLCIRTLGSPPVALSEVSGIHLVVRSS
jgi:CRISPR-associated protein Cas2